MVSELTAGQWLPPGPPSSDLVSRGNGLNMGGPDQVNEIHQSYHQDICLKLEIQKNG